MVNLCEHQDGGESPKELSVAEALSRQVARSLRRQVPRVPDRPRTRPSPIEPVPDTLIPNPDLSNIPVARERVFEFGRGGKQTTIDPITAFRVRGASRPTAARTLLRTSAASRRRQDTARAKSGP